jgi:broad specificity phosphatase PhoE
LKKKEENMKKRICFWVIRHGEKDGDMLTEKGVQQVRLAARLLDGTTFRAAFHSGMKRAEQTVLEILSATGQKKMKPEANVGFGYEWAEKEYPLTPVIRKIATDGKNNVTAADWLKAWPGARLIRERFASTMLGLTRTLVKHFPEEKEIDVLVGSHGPTGELATLEPETTRVLELAGIICYVIMYDEQTGKAEIAHSVRLYR